MATSSIFADFNIKDKTTARAFLKALEASEADPRITPEHEFRLLTDPKEIRERFKSLIEKRK